MPVRSWTTKSSQVIRRNRRTPSRVSRVSRVSRGRISQDADWKTTAGRTRKEEKDCRNEPERRKKTAGGTRKEEKDCRSEPERTKQTARRNQKR